MTEREMDAVMRQALLDAIALEWADTEGAEPQRGSARYERSLAAMCRDPLKWCRRRTRPVWKKVLQTAAMFALVCALALGSLLAVSPTARAVLRRWLVEVRDRDVVYSYTGDPLEGDMPQYILTEIPDGYELDDILEQPGYISYTYVNATGQRLYFDCMYMDSNKSTAFLTANMNVYNVDLNGCPGTILISSDPRQSNAITWVDEESNLQFLIDGFFDREDLFDLAESVKQKK